MRLLRRLARRAQEQLRRLCLGGLGLLVFEELVLG